MSATKNSFSSALTPTADLQYDLGTPSNRWRSFYLGSNSIYFGPKATLGTDPNGVVYSQYGFATPDLVLGAPLPPVGNVVGQGIALGYDSVTQRVTQQYVNQNGSFTGTLYSLTTFQDLIPHVVSEFMSYNKQYMGNVSTSSNYQNSSTIMFDSVAPYNDPRIFCSTTLASTGDGSLSGSDIIYLTNPGTYRVDTAFSLARSNNGHMHFAQWLTYNGSRSNIFLVNFPTNPDFLSVNTVSYIKLPQSNSTLQVHYNFEAHQCYLESSISSLAPVSYTSAMASIAYIGTYS